MHIITWKIYIFKQVKCYISHLHLLDIFIINTESPVSSVFTGKKKKPLPHVWVLNHWVDILSSKNTQRCQFKHTCCLQPINGVEAGVENMFGFFLFCFLSGGGRVFKCLWPKKKTIKKSIIMFEWSEGEPDLLSLLWALFSSFRICVSVILSSHEVRKYKEWQTPQKMQWCNFNFTWYKKVKGIMLWETFLFKDCSFKSVFVHEYFM